MSEESESTPNWTADADGRRRSQRTRRPVERYQANFSLETAYKACAKVLRVCRRKRTVQLAFHFALLLNPVTGLMDDIPVTSYADGSLKANKHDPDLPKYRVAMAGPHRDQFIEAMVKEVKELEEFGTWTEVPNSGVPKGKQVLPGTWVLRIKRYPDGRLRKFKARYCVRGDMQVEGVDYFEKYAPVVNWSTVRLLLCISETYGWATKQIDYSNAFVQATLDESVYIRPPPMFDTSKRPDHVLKLNKSLYGLVQHLCTGITYVLVSAPPKNSGDDVSSKAQCRGSVPVLGERHHGSV